jgi:hypothetical protein
LIFDSIVNRNEFFSNHYLDVLVHNDLSGLRKRWDERDDRLLPTGRAGVRQLAKPFFAAKAPAAEGGAHQVAGVRALHDVVLRGLGWTPDRHEVALSRGDAEEVTVPVAHAASDHTGLLLVALECGFATDADAALDPDGAGALLDPVLIDGGRTKLTSAADAASYLFACDDPPRYVLLLAAGFVVLADRAKWGEGRFLAVDLDTALSRGDAKAKGELETIAALFSADALVPAEEGEGGGQSVLDQLDSASQRHAVGVSKDLREGIRRSVELLANEAVTQLRAAKRGVFERGLDEQLTRESLRFLYRLLFLLYAEARPELGILPLDHPEYAEGYGLDRLRDLALVTLSDPKARDGSHLHQSLNLLFRLVNDGYHHTYAEQVLMDERGADVSEDVGLRFEPLHSELFAPGATKLLDSIRLRNHVLQEVLQLLLLSKETKGRERGFVSYAQLGINQLGAVYEGLMSYTGFFAETDLYEVSRPGAEDKGTWVVPVERAGEYPEDVFVTRPDPETGQPRPVRHEKGSFVFRLSGRDRQRSASYYTPEVLTRCVVRHALAELFDQPASDDPDGPAVTTPASRILELTVCEPALGSGAFLNEAINQLAAEYLRRREIELDTRIDPEERPAELQKVKAHLALHRCYGVDLNATAVELAEVSLWLNAMHRGLQAPWFGLHLRRGNSLVGARRAVYPSSLLGTTAKGEWLTTVPTDRPLSGGPIEPGEVHHFLVPAHGWAAVGDAKQARELRPDAVKKLKAWRTGMKKPFLAQEVDRLVGLARRVEDEWQHATNRLQLAERDLRRPIAVWGAELPVTERPASREVIEAALRDPESSLGRLRLVMDAWCALWFWPIDGPDGMPDPPSRQQWLSALEGLLGRSSVEPQEGQQSIFTALEDLLADEEAHRFEHGKRPVADVRADHPWLDEVARIREKEGFWHWELEFAPVFERGGFDLQVGNPPWAKLARSDTDVLIDADPRWEFYGIPTGKDFDQAVVQLCSDHMVEIGFLDACAHTEGSREITVSGTRYPFSMDLSANIYQYFIETALRNISSSGVAGLVHPEFHLTDAAGAKMRRKVYGALRRHFQFRNELKLFEDVNNPVSFGIHVYASEGPINFIQIAQLVDPETVDSSFSHDGRGPLPGLRGRDGSWDRRGHAARLVRVDERVLESWAAVFDEPETPIAEARLIRPITAADLGALVTLGALKERVADHAYTWTSGLHEKGARLNGIIQRRTAVPASNEVQILQGPHFTVANPFSQQPNDPCRNNRDYSPWDLLSLPEDAVPRTNYQVICDQAMFSATASEWRDKPITAYWRHIHREMTESGVERSVQGAIIPPGVTHVHTCLTYAFASTASLLRYAALMASLPVDYLFKVSGSTHVDDFQLRRLPLPSQSKFDTAAASRILRLNCLTRAYASLWEELFEPAWQFDRWTDPDSTRPPLGDVTPEWTMATPLRLDYDRRMALVELDALAALILGLSAEQLCAMYRTQFAVLRKYEYVMRFDANGRQVDKTPEGKALLKAWAADPEAVEADPARWGRYVPPFTAPDREAEMTRAYDEFARRLAAGEL